MVISDVKASARPSNVSEPRCLTPSPAQFESRYRQAVKGRLDRCNSTAGVFGLASPRHRLQALAIDRRCPVVTARPQLTAIAMPRTSIDKSLRAFNLIHQSEKLGHFEASHQVSPSQGELLPTVYPCSQQLLLAIRPPLATPTKMGIRRRIRYFFLNVTKPLSDGAKVFRLTTIFMAYVQTP